VNQAEIDQQYNAVLSVDDVSIYADFDKQTSLTVRHQLNTALDVSYGEMPDQTLDIFPAKNSNAQVIIFIHGGYWRSLSNKEFSYVAKGFVDLGFTVVLPNYSLCPEVSISQITAQNQQAVKWDYHNIHRYNGDKFKIHLSGHSAGAHQAVMLAMTDWKLLTLPEKVIKSCTAISGIYDLSPLIHSWLQADLQLNDEMICQQSPLLILDNIKKTLPPLLIIVGELESSEFQRQSKELQPNWIQYSNKSRILIINEKNHFNVIHSLAEPCSYLLKQIKNFIVENV